MMHKTTRKLLDIGLVISAVAICNIAQAAGDPAQGEQKAQICASCHGTNGISPTPNFPILAGQYADYLVRALQDYKSGERDNAIMKGFAVNLSKQDMADLAAWFASQDALTAPRIDTIK